MADQIREIERKYEATADGLPDLTGVPGVGAVIDHGVTDLDALYYDTPPLGPSPTGDRGRLAADGITLRRRNGGDDEGWHLKLPVGPDEREEIRAPLSDELPAELAGLVRSRVRSAPLHPVVRVRTRRDRRHLLDADGALLAEVSVDEVTAERPPSAGAARTAHWTEIEVELAPGADPGVLDTVERVLHNAGVHRAAGPSKLVRALAETRPAGGGPLPADRPGAGRTEQPAGKAGKAKGAKADRVKGGKKAGAGRKKAAKGAEPPRATAGDHLLAYLRAQVTAMVELDPAVRRDRPDAVHRMRVATRRLRSAFTSFRPVLDRRATDPLRAELKWLAGELGAERDREVLTERLHHRLGELPGKLLLGPVHARLDAWSEARRGDARRRVTAALDHERYVALLDALEALLADPPLRPASRRPPLDVLPDVVLRDFDRLARRMDTALSAPRGPERDTALHEARKAAKRVRYAAETARPAVGKPAKRFVKRMKGLQNLLGDHQDSVVAREALREIAVQAHTAGENAFTYGVLYGHEEARATEDERELPRAWRDASRRRLRTALRG